MSLIVTHITAHGIIHGTDEYLTSGRSHAGVGRKLFQLPFLNAALTVAGAYSVGKEPMDKWMDEFILHRKKSNCASLQLFAKELGRALEAEMTRAQKGMGSMVHIVGYVRDASGCHPELWFVRNIYSMDQTTGQYSDIRDTFQVTEDFWHRDWHQNNLATLFKTGGYQLYTNGFTSGLVSYMVLQDSMSRFFTRIWSNHSWQFRPPVSLGEWELVVDLYIRTICVLFQLSNYSAPFIGGSPQTYAIPKPTR